MIRWLLDIAADMGDSLLDGYIVVRALLWAPIGAWRDYRRWEQQMDEVARIIRERSQP